MIDKQKDKFPKVSQKLSDLAIALVSPLSQNSCQLLTSNGMYKPLSYDPLAQDQFSLEESSSIIPRNQLIFNKQYENIDCNQLVDFQNGQCILIGKKCKVDIGLHDKSISDEHAILSYNDKKPRVFKIQNIGQIGTYVKLNNKQSITIPYNKPFPTFSLGSPRMFFRIQCISKQINSQITFEIQMFEIQEDTLKFNQVSNSKFQWNTKEKFKIGSKASACDFVYQDILNKTGQRLVSSVHMLISFKQDDIEFVDNSLNGTWRQLLDGEQYVIQNQDSFRIGSQEYSIYFNAND